MAKRRHSRVPKGRSRALLLIEDNPDHVQLLTEALATHWPTAKVHAVDAVDDGIELVGRNRYDAVFIDAFCQNRSVVHHLPTLCSLAPGTPILVLAGSGDESLAAEAIRLGAADYLVKNRATLVRLPTLVRKYLTGRGRARPRALPTAPPLRRLVHEIESLAARLKGPAPRGKGTKAAAVGYQLRRLQALAHRVLPSTKGRR